MDAPDPDASATPPTPLGWRGRLRYRDLVLADRWFPPGAEISAGEAPHATFVVPDLEGREDAAPTLLVAHGRLVVAAEGPPPTAKDPLELQPAGCPDVHLTLHPEPAAPSPPGAGVAWRDLARHLLLGALALTLVSLIAAIEGPAPAPEAAGTPGYGDDDLSPIAWAMFNAPVYDPSADPSRPPGPAAAGSRSRAGVADPGERGESVEASGPRPGDGAASTDRQRAPPLTGDDAPTDTIEERPALTEGEGQGTSPGEITPMSEGAGGVDDGLGLPGEGGPQGPRDGDAPEEGGRGGRTDADPNARGRGGELRAIERAIVGRHRFGVQFIWEGYGHALITRDGDGLRIAGEQRNDVGDFVTIQGTLRIVDAKTIEVEGTIATRIASCCGAQTQTGVFTLRKSGRRRFWRLDSPHRERFCDKYTCHYYIDLFDR